MSLDDEVQLPRMHFLTCCPHGLELLLLLLCYSATPEGRTGTLPHLQLDQRQRVRLEGRSGHRGKGDEQGELGAGAWEHAAGSVGVDEAAAVEPI